ncbi:hypothetical protein [Methanolobus psychrotolerans]|uniref:hypothetical protein n=1 Tax=Methanolobus psychrotolerans TaxID=1874706 RepID=UPI000B919E8A|nr:hypothetical protein [Methanolobus psychrotolerans]
MARKNNRTYKYDSVKDIVQTDRAFQKWIMKPKDAVKDKKEGTRQTRTYTMNMFIHYLHENGMTDTTPTKLITHALTHQKSKNKKFENAVTPEDFEVLIFSDDDEIGDYERILTEYKNYLLSNQKASTAKSNFHRLLNFYKSFKVDVSNIDARINAPVSIKSKKAPSFELLKKAFDKANSRDKCIISCGVTSGMARLDISTLTHGEFIDGLKQVLDNDDNPMIDSNGNIVEVCVLERNREKNDNPYHTFLAPETVRCIQKYIDERNDINQNEIDYLMRRIYSSTDVIFINSKFDEKKETIPFKDSIVKDKNGNVIAYDDSIRAMGNNAITKMYARLRKVLNIPTVEGEYSKLRSHGVRHYFSNNYKNIDSDYKEHWMGHGGNTVKITYEDYNSEEGLQIYLKGLDGITFGDIVNYIDITDPSVDKIRYENKELRDRLDTIEQLLTDREASEKTLDVLKNKFENSNPENMDFEERALYDKWIANRTKAIKQKDNELKDLRNQK